MKARTLLLVVMALVPLMTFARMVKYIDPGTLIRDAKLVFVGRVKSVKPSDIRTSLSYVPYEGVTFRWLMVQVEVLEPFKGVRKSALVRTAMLSVDEASQYQTCYSPPGMLEPEKGDVFFFCLAPTQLTNVYASVTAPYDENQSVFPLYRSRPTKAEGRDTAKQILTGREWEQITNFGNLVNNAGRIIPASADKLREAYTVEIGNVPSNKLVYLQWETATNSDGWRTDVPKGYMATTATNGR
jgi:hypothetical protein